MTRGRIRTTRQAREARAKALHHLGSIEWVKAGTGRGYTTRRVLPSGAHVTKRYSS